MVKAQSHLAKTQTRLSSGKEIVNPSDAPEKATAVQRLKSVLSRQESFAGNITGADNRLIAEETALKGVNDVLTRIKNCDSGCQWNFRSSGQRVSGYRNRGFN